MPWKLQQSEGGYYVIDDKGKKYSKKPMSKSRAMRQMRALYANEGVKKEAPLTVYKDGQEWRWVLRSSTAYRDRDGEIVSIKALEDDCDRADATKDYGPLRWWHVPGMDIGRCDFNMVYGKTLVESGTFDSPEIAQAVAKEAHNLQVSIGFNHPRNQPDGAGVFHQIKRFERSLLPKGRASNPFTALSFVRKEHNEMANTQEKVKAFIALLKDPSLADGILAAVKEGEAAADAAGVEFKETDEAETEKAKGPQVEIELETEDEEEMGEDEDMEDEKAFDDGGPFVGDLTPDDFGMLLANSITRALEPVVQSVKELQEQQITTKEQRQKENQSRDEMIKSLEARIKELEGETPRAVKGYVASAAKDNLVGEGHRLKDSAPHEDPAGGFMNFLLGQK